MLFHHVMFWTIIMLVSYNAMQRHDPKNQLLDYSICADSFRIVTLPKKYKLFDESAVFPFERGCRESYLQAASKANRYIYEQEAIQDRYIGRVSATHRYRDRIQHYYRGDPSYQPFGVKLAAMFCIGSGFMIFNFPMTVMWWEIIMMKWNRRRR